MPRRMQCPKGHEIEFPDPDDREDAGTAQAQPSRRGMREVVILEEEPVECGGCGASYFAWECKPASP